MKSLHTLIRNLNKFLTHISWYYAVLGICIIAILALWGTTRYYFYLDDYALLYNLQNNLSFVWPYHTMVAIYKPFFMIFGINVKSYFILSFLTYVFAAIIMYLFTFLLTKHKQVAFISSLLFATGYIGIDQFTQTSLATINNLSLIFVCLTLIVYLFWIDTRKLRYYFAGLLLFGLSLWIFTHRAYYLILFLPLLEIVLTIRREKLYPFAKRFMFVVARFFPFTVLAYMNGIFSQEISAVVDPSYSNNTIFSLISFPAFREFISVLGGFFLLNQQMKYKANFIQNDMPFIVALFMMLFMGIIFIRRYKHYSRLCRSMVFTLFGTFAAYTGPFLLLQQHLSLSPTSRYMIPVGLMFCILLTSFFFLTLQEQAVKKRDKYRGIFLSISIVIIFAFGILSWQYQKDILVRSENARDFYTKIFSFVPTIRGKATFYIDFADYFPATGKRQGILLGGAMGPEASLAIFYKVPIESITLVENFPDLIKTFQEKKTTFENLHAFFYDEKDLFPITPSLISLVTNGSTQKLNSNQYNILHENALPILDIYPNDLQSMSALNLKLQMAITPVQAGMQFPYSIQKLDDEKKIKYKTKLSEKDKIFNFLAARSRYYSEASVSVSSFHFQYPKEFLLDDTVEKAWLDDEGRWQYKRSPWILIDLSREKQISTIIWAKAVNRVPSKYQFSYSLDQKSWNKLDVTHSSFFYDENEYVIERFLPVNARYVKLTIYETENGFTPCIAEIEVVEHQYQDVDYMYAYELQDQPFLYIHDSTDLGKTYSFLNKEATMTIKSKTNNEDSIDNEYEQKIPVFIDSNVHEYTISIPPRGTKLKEIQVLLHFPAEISAKSVTIDYSLLNEILSK